MYRRFQIIKYALIALIFISLFGGCAVYDKYFGESDEEKRPDELMEQGLQRMDRGDYQAATESFQAIKDRYPYSKYAVTADLKIADSLYYSYEYVAAAGAYDEFEKLHPKDNNIPYVIYQKGMCHFQQVKSIDRDQSETLKAKEEFERVIKRFPRSDYANNARKNLRQCLIYLAEYELYVGHFYFKMGKYQAALDRYTYLIENYPDMGQYHEALEYISLCKAKLAEAEAEKKQD